MKIWTFFLANDNEEERLFGSISGDNEDGDVVSKSGEDFFDEDDGTFNNVYKNRLLLTFS